MTRVINCPDGFTARGDTDEELIAKVREHLKEKHADMVNQTDEQILAMAQPA